MNNGWIKLYRKSKDNNLMRDANAWMVFCWILLTVDRVTAEMKCGRIWASEYFQMKPTTFRDALYRLRDKYKVIATSSDNKKTTIRVLNWAKYQEENDATSTPPHDATGNSLENRESTPTTLLNQRHPDATYTRSREDKNIYNYEEKEKNSDEFSLLKKQYGKEEKHLTQEFQVQAMEIITALKIPPIRRSAYFAAIKKEPRGRILSAYSFAVDHPTPSARDKMFFWRLNQLKNEKLTKHNYI